MQIFTGSSGCSLVQKLPEFTRGERSSRRGYFYLQQIVRLRIPDGMRSWAHLDAGMQDSASRRCQGWGNPNQMERAEDHCRNNIHSGLRKPHGCNEKVLHKRRGHWTIDNNLHWMLDVTFKEDASKARKGYAAENLSLVRKLALQIVKQHNDKRSIKKTTFPSSIVSGLSQRNTTQC